jgi:hypothetical protein
MPAGACDYIYIYIYIYIGIEVTEDEGVRGVEASDRNACWCLTL